MKTRYVRCVVALVCVLGVVPRQVGSANGPSTYRYSRVVGGHTLTITIEVGQFDSALHHIEHVSTNAGYRIDGEIPIGNDGTTTATTEFKRLEISWDGKNVKLPRRAWSAIFNVPLQLIRYDHNTSGFAVLPADDGSAVLLIFKTGLADVGPEQAWLFVDRNGNWRRFYSRIAED
jgi:hypothetical protein